ncbi:hypothetical protein ACFW9N_45160 [Streptomyces sp. NPDC059496]|uniref:hypothetical protein n=1 Tax=Streptomyces sp. NPDC059496 TaxID=3346851 RepID=UPI0036D1546C
MARERIRWPLVVERARQIVDGYAPLKVTLRQVMYRLAAEGVLPHTPPMYRRLSSRLAQARREGRFPDLIDTMREVHVPPAWPDADAFVAEMPSWFRLDRTTGQKQALYVAAEKDTLRQQLTGWLEFAGPGEGCVCARHDCGGVVPVSWCAEHGDTVAPVLEWHPGGGVRGNNLSRGGRRPRGHVE